jgi:4-diphosphocytidyl-2-C-methyl-D-erythritol kinase
LQSGVAHVKAAQVRVQAPAKINLILRVLDRRPDGYHNVWSLMQTVGLCDDLRITVHPTDSPAVELRCDDATLPVDRTNLVFRAATLVLERTHHRVKVSIELHKRIPMGAGLGGGSSDAAATILGLNHLLELGWSQSVMADIGQMLGSDVPFFFAAPTAVATGRGERAEQKALAEGRRVLLVNPGFAVDTRWAYRELSSSRQVVTPVHESAQRLGRKQVLEWETIVGAAVNDFEDPVYGAHPILRDIKDGLIAAGAELALLSGSGATVFGIFREEARASQAHAWFSRDPQHKVYLVETSRQPLVCR